VLKKEEWVFCYSFRTLLTRADRFIGTSCGLGSVGDGGAESISVVAPNHPIAKEIKDFKIPRTEYFGEPFDVPEPEAVVFRSTLRRAIIYGFVRDAAGQSVRVAYSILDRGHETFPIMRQPEVQKVIYNATLWSANRT